MQKKLLVKKLRDQQNDFSILLYKQKSIGKGGFGSCYLGFIPEHSQIVAIKCISRKNDKRSPQALQQMYNKQINNLAILTKSSNSIYETNKKISYFVEIEPYKIKSQNNFYIVMQFCQGGSLNDLLTKKRETEWFSYSQLLLIMQHLIEGCQSMRSLEIVHNDLKPDNVLIKDGIFKIADFGLARSLKNIIPGRVGGTSPYIPPEKVLPNYVADYSTDIYALGVIFYYLVYDQHPYFSYEQILDHWDKLYKLVRQKPLRQRKCLIRNIDSNSQTILQDLLKKMVDKDPAKRPTIEEISTKFRKTLLHKTKPDMKFQYKKIPLPQNFMVYVSEQSQVITDRIRDLIIDNKAQNAKEKELNPKLLELRNSIEEENWKAKCLGELHYYFEQQSRSDQEIAAIMPKIISFCSKSINHKIQIFSQKIAKLARQDKYIVYTTQIYPTFNVLKNNSHHFQRQIQHEPADFKIVCINVSKVVEDYIKRSFWLSEKNYRLIRALLLIKELADNQYVISGKQLAEVTNQIVNKNNYSLDILNVFTLASQISQLVLQLKE